MNDEQFLCALRSVGMTAFVTHLALFEGPLRDADATAHLQDLTGWKPKATRARVSNARSILGHGRRADALRAIAGSSLPDPIRDMARLALR